jgi:membrane protein implicated in regulation of membrane protease activity
MELREWVVLVATIIVGILALAFASGTHDPINYTIALIVFLAAVVFAFLQVKRYFDRVERSRR